MYVKIVNHSNHPLPEYATVLSAGMDLRANIPEPILLKPFERKLIQTGLFVELPAGYEAQIRPRSGLAIKKGITVLNSPGTIDADYSINCRDEKKEMREYEQNQPLIILFPYNERLELSEIPKEKNKKKDRIKLSGIDKEE